MNIPLAAERSVHGTPADMLITTWLIKGARIETWLITAYCHHSPCTNVIASFCLSIITKIIGNAVQGTNKSQQVHAMEEVRLVAIRNEAYK